MKHFGLNKFSEYQFFLIFRNFYFNTESEETLFGSKYLSDMLKVKSMMSFYILTVIIICL